MESPRYSLSNAAAAVGRRALHAARARRWHHGLGCLGGVAACALAIAGGEARAQVAWTEVLPPGGRGLAHAAIAYDSARGRLIRYGGGGSQGLSDATAAWDGSRWIDLSPAVNPGPRSNHAMAYDTARDRLVLYGSGNSQETWEWDGSTWIQATPATNPGARAGAAMVYDAARGRVVLFGGAPVGFPNDTWEYDGGTWIRRELAVNPAARSEHAMAYDSVRSRVVLFGGASAGLHGDTWEYDGTTWTRLSPAVAPTARTGTTMVFDPAMGRTILFGGYDAGGHADDTWAWDGSTWRQLSPAENPPARRDSAGAYDVQRQELVVFGGSGPEWSRLSDTWSWQASRGWTVLGASAMPLATVDHAMAYDEARGRTVVFGLGNHPRNRDETWLWDGSTWERPRPATSPSARGKTAMAYDPIRERVVLFGGSAGVAQDLGDTWEWDGTTWLERTPSVAPPKRNGHAMVFDRERGQIVLFGGRSGASLSDTWVWDGNTWRDVSPPGSPSPRRDHAMAYDEQREVVVMHGGQEATFLLRGDTWEWDGTAWTSPSSTSSYLRLSQAAMVYDAARQRVVLHGGMVGLYGGSATSDTWEWDGRSWTLRTPASSVPWRMWHAMAYDSARRRIVRFGGTANTIVFADIWEFGPTFPADYASFGAGCAGSAGTPALSAAGGLLPWIGEAFELTVTNVPAGQPVTLLLGGSSTQWGSLSLPYSLAWLGLPGCELSVSPDVSVPLAPQGGAAAGVLHVPAVAAILGQSIYVQALLRDPGHNPAGLITSNAGQLTLGAK